MSIEKQTVRTALIGAGNFAQRQHLPNLFRIPEADLSVICDIDEERARASAGDYGASFATDYREVLSDDSIDLVVVTTRTDLQAPIAVEALQAGKHVYVEKPLAETPEACERVISARDASGKRVAVGFNKRFAPVYRKAKQVMDADGGPKNLQLRMADDAWRWAKGYGPGDLVRLDVCHFFDLLRWFTSAEIRTIYCTHAREDDECITVTMTNGTVASILFSGHGTMDMPKERIDAICTRGGLCAEDYVQLNTYGYHDFASTYRFGGHSSPEGEFMHSFLLSDIGLEGWRAIRRRTWELREQTGCEDNAADPYHHEKSEYVKNNIPNFMRDQGWLAALRSFVVALRDGSPSDHAGPEDALQTVRASAAADESRKRGTAVPCA